MSESPLPESLRIGAHTWRVVKSKKAWAKTHLPEEHVGRCDGMNSVIHIKPGLELQYERATLMHEILHACRFASGQAVDLNDAEESYIQLVDAILVAVLQDNPDLLDYLGIGA